MSRAQPAIGRDSPAAGASQKALLETLRKGRVTELEALLLKDASAAHAQCTDAQLDKLVAVANGAARREQQRWSLLHVACYYAPAGAVQLLLQHGATTSSTASPCRWTPAMVACCRTDSGAALDILQAMAAAKQTPLGKARGTASCLSLALVHSRSSKGAAGRSSSSANGASSSSSSSHASSGADASIQLLQWLVQHGAMPASMLVAAAEEVGRQLLLAGVAHQLLPLMRKADRGFAQGSTGFAGVFRGITFCREVPPAEVEAAVKLLIQQPFQVNAPLEAKDMTPGQAALRGHPCVLKTLLEAGLDVHARLDNMSTLLHLACNASASHDNPHAPALVQMLLDAGADPNVRDASGELPLGIATTYSATNSASAVITLLWPPVTADAAELWFEGAPVSMYKELAKANKHQMATVQAALVKSQAAADSSRATMVMHLLCPQDIEQLFTLLPLLAVPTPARQLAHGLIWVRWLDNIITEKGAMLLRGYDANTGMVARGTGGAARLEGSKHIKLSTAEMKVYINFFRKHPEVPALQYAVHLLPALAQAMCPIPQLVALMPAGLKAALNAKDSYLSCGRMGEEIYRACACSVGTVCTALGKQVHEQPEAFQPFLDAKHHLDLAAVVAHSSRPAFAVGALTCLMALQVVQVEVVEYWQQHPSGWENLAGVVHKMCDICEGKVEATTPAELHEGVGVIRCMMPCVLQGHVLVGGTGSDTIKGSDWSPAWDRRLHACKLAFMRGLLKVLDRLSEIPIELPQLKRGQMVDPMFSFVQQSIALARNFLNKPLQLDAIVQPPPYMQRGLMAAPPVAELNMGARKCAQCGATSQVDGKALLLCPGCKVTRYCSRECQLVNWKAVHKHQCKKSYQ